MDNNHSPAKPIKVTSEPPPSDADRWYDYILSTKQNEPNRLEDAAKFLATIISLSLTIFLTMAGGNSDLKTHPQFPLIKLAIATWLLALLSAFFVLFPWRYHYLENSVQSIKKTHQKLVRVKQIFLILSLILFLAALVTLGWVLL